LAQLVEEVYPELRLMARRHMRNERQENTLQTTALVHEVYLRLVDVTKIEWKARAQFFAIAAQLMRRILVDAARARGAGKRGSGARKVNLDETALVSRAFDQSILLLDEALAEFSQMAPRQAKVVELRYFGGLTEEEIVAALNISERTVRRDWDFARSVRSAPKCWPRWIPNCAVKLSLCLRVAPATNSWTGRHSRTTRSWPT
jgi:RNA polymerase sigma factor (TIGR02999 family)